MKRHALLFASALALAACTAASDPATDVTEATPAEMATSEALPQLEFEKFTLDNGLDVILHVDKSDPIVAINLAAHVGSARELTGKTGFAHLFEHLLFLDSENLGYGGLDLMNTRIGGEGTNGFTTTDMTQYFQAVPADALEKVIWAEADKLGWFINTVNQNVIDREKQVVKNEKRQRVDNQPYGHNFYVIGKAIYPEGHPYHHTVIGSLEDLENATLQDTKDFFAKWYTPQNVTVTITGDFDPAEARSLVEKYFGEIPAGETQPERTVENPTLTETISLLHEDNFAKLPRLTMVWPTVPEYHPDSYALSVLMTYLTEGKRAPFNEVLIDEEQLTTGVSGFTYEKELAGEVYLSLSPKAGEDIDDLVPAIATAFARFEENGIPEEALDRIKTVAEVSVYDEVQSALGKAIALAEYNLFRDDPGYLDDDIAALRAVTADNVMDVYNRYIKDKPYVATSFVPKGSPELGLEGAEIAEVVEEVVVQGAEADVPYDPDARVFEPTPSAFDRTVEPPFGEAYTLPVPSIWTTEAANGLEIVGIQSDEVPLIEFSIDFDAGKNRATSDKPGVAAMMGDLLMKGAGDLDTAGFEEALGNLGSSVSVSTGNRFTTIRGKTLARNLDATVALIDDMINAPAFDEAEFETLREQYAQGAVAAQANPNFLASQAEARLTYPAESALSVAGSGSEDQIRAVTLDDLKAFHTNYMDVSTATLNIVGDYEEADILSVFGGIDDPVEGDLTPKPRPAMAPVDETVIYFHDVPEAKQSVIRMARPAVTSTDPDYPILDALNFPLGGIYTSKLMTELRVNKGYTYGIGSGAAADKDTGSFVVRTSVRTNATKESLELIRDIVADHGRTMTEAELSEMQESLMRGQALETETLGDKLGLVQDISRNDLPADIKARRMARVQGMTLDDAVRVSEAHIRPDAMRIIVVGDAASQKARLEELGYEVVDLN
ncbi:M16 family metallopeptidase [Algimonas porphyrae]|uniref:Peptidase M16 n=1 Tax=Algimonas porphyrae TaxID=1128113 RepID=A0ABQ5UXG5_9PROT|nr:pitrilysin family protein [Algimonas porphyrae]GLQ19397.1 peptidase M16 [Algimonas porphyrae]